MYIAAIVPSKRSGLESTGIVQNFNTDTRIPFRPHCSEAVETIARANPAMAKPCRVMLLGTHVMKSSTSWGCAFAEFELITRETLPGV